VGLTGDTTLELAQWQRPEMSFFELPELADGGNLPRYDPDIIRTHSPNR